MNETDPEAPSLFAQLGGEAPLRAIVDDFVDRVFQDTMIGFFFANADRARIKAKEYELAAAHLGADVVYTGRGLPEAHEKHPIMGGHFMRRMQILKETLQAHGAPPRVAEHWLANNERMRSAITSQSGSACDHDAGEALAEPRRLPLAFGAMVKREPEAHAVPPRVRRELPVLTSETGSPKDSGDPDERKG